MPVIHQFFPSASLILTLLQFLRPTFSQLYPLSNSSSAPTTTTSSLSPSSTPTVFPAYNFTYPDFPDQYNTGIQVSYKDTIDVAWVANGAQHTPVLQIQCWTRNDSSSFICEYSIHHARLSHCPLYHSSPSSFSIEERTNERTNERTTAKCFFARLRSPYILHPHPSHAFQLLPRLFPRSSFTLSKIQPLPIEAPGPRRQRKRDGRCDFHQPADKRFDARRYVGRR